MKLGKKEIAIGAGLGLLVYFLFPKQAKAAVSSLTEGDFEMFQGVKFWSKGAMPRVKAKLSESGIIPLGVDSLPMAAELRGPGSAESALQWVLRKQHAGWFVASSDNLLTGVSADRPLVNFFTQKDMDVMVQVLKASPGWASIPPV